MKKEPIKNRFRNPRTPEELQDAMDAAYACITLDDARQYGLVIGGPKINVDRAEEILALGKAAGYTPSPDAIERFLLGSPRTKARAGCLKSE